MIEGKAAAVDEAPWRQALYLPADRQSHSLVDFRAIPYYAWDNREPGEMAVWLPRINGGAGFPWASPSSPRASQPA